MKSKLLIATITLFTLQSCEFNKSINKNFSSGLSTQGDGLSSENVYLSIDDKEINSSTFIYGQTFYVNFNKITGFVKEGEAVFPGMELCVVGKDQDTVLYGKDMYAEYTDGVTVTPLLLNANITVADPMKTGNKYTLYVNIWDKKGTGTFKAEMEFDIVPNDKITIVSNNVTYDNIYLFSENNNTTITDNRVKMNDNTYLIFEGLKGFKEENGKANIGLSIKSTDAEGNVIVNEEDLVGDSGYDMAELNKQIAPNVIYSGSDIINPTKLEVVIWDKSSDTKITATTDLELYK